MTLKAKTSLLLVWLMLVAIGGTGFLYTRFLNNTIRASVHSGLEGISSVASTAIVNYLRDLRRDAEWVRKHIETEIRAGDLPGVEKMLQQLDDFLPRFDNGLFLLDSSGRFIADAPTHPELIGNSLAHREYFRSTVRKQYGVIGQPYRSGRTGEVVLTFTEPIFSEDGALLAVVGCSSTLLNVDALGGVLQTKIGEKGYLYVVDSSRLMILHPDPERVTRTAVPEGVNHLLDLAINEGFEGVGDTVNSLGIEMMLSLHRIPDTDWILGVQIPKAEALAPLETVRTRLLLAAAIAVTLSVLAGLFAVGRITAPLQQLRTAALRLGEYLSSEHAAGLTDSHLLRVAEDLPMSHKGDEIGDLAQTFAGLVETLRVSFQSLRRSNEEWRRTFDSVPDPLCILDSQGGICRINRAGAEIFCKSGEDGESDRAIWSTFEAEDATIFRDRMSFTLETGTPTLKEWQHADSGRRFATTLVPVRGQHEEREKLVFVAQDITARSTAERSLRDSEQRYRNLFENAGDAIFVLERSPNRDYRFSSVNSAATRMYGYDREALLRMSLSHLCGPEGDENRRRLVQEISYRWTKLECVHRRQDGTCFPVEISAGPLSSGDDRYALAIVRDVSGRKAAEEALRKSEERFRDLAELLPEIVFETDDRGLLQFVNHHACNLTKYAQEELVGSSHWGDLVSPRDRVRAEAELSSVIRRGGAGGGEYTFLRKDGSTFMGLARFASIAGESGTSGARGIVIDITGRKQMETQLRQAGKMEAIGQLAGGIAHDFNNLLTPILGYAEMALEDIHEDDDLRQMLEHILRASVRAKELVNQVLIFSRQSEEEDQAVAVGPLLREAIKLLRASLPSTIELRSSIAQDVGYTLASPAQLHQILINLGTNAGQALGHSTGTIKVSADREYIDDVETVEQLALSPGEYVVLRVRDNGPGIDPEYVEKVFDPFFTTKEVGEGSGLGLSVVHGIVTKLGGIVNVETELGKGTLFTVYLPACNASAVSEQEVEKAFDVGGKDCILLVDDEQVVIDFLHQVLERRGYDVVSTTSSVDAFERFKASPKGFDLVITDQTMPEMTGITLIREIRRIASDVPVILCTGYSHTITPEILDSEAISTCLMKPVSIRDLSHAVHAALLSSNPPAE